VIGMLWAADVPGENDVSSVHAHDEPLFPDRQGAFLRPADLCRHRRDARGRRGARRTRVKIEYRDLDFIIPMCARRRLLAASW
jgi:xanthine dehydrogenase large subunit